MGGIERGAVYFSKLFVSNKEKFRCIAAHPVVWTSLNNQLENVAIIAMYCHLRPPDAIA